MMQHAVQMPDRMPPGMTLAACHRSQLRHVPQCTSLPLTCIPCPSGRGPKTVVDKVNLMSEELGITPEVAVKVLLPGRSGTVSSLSTSTLQQKLQRIKQAVKDTPWSPADILIATPRLLGMSFCAALLHTLVCSPTVAQLLYVTVLGHST